MRVEARRMPKAGIDRAVDLVRQNSYSNPRVPDVRALGHMLQQAWKGLPPEPME
ncbi:hypothetical protein [Paraburkholderia sp. BR10954]|uniref:hypothetical protein n=1 Tax=Paraburkholderia sp. BR10954 TaxID=3236995 RepID=UPI0034D33D65